MINFQLVPMLLLQQGSCVRMLLPHLCACVLSSGCHLMQLGIVERYILLLKCHEWIRHRENIVCVHFEVNKIFLCSCDLDGFRYCLYCPTILEEVSWRLVQTTV